MPISAAQRRLLIGWILAIALTFVAVPALYVLHMPAPFLLGSMLAALISAISTSARIKPKRFLISPSQGTIALLAAGPLVTADFSQIAALAFPTLLAVAGTLAFCLAASWFIKRWSHVDISTAIMSTLAGGASAMSVLSEQLGADFRYVTVSQFMRIIFVSFSLPFVLPLFAGGSVNVAQGPLLELSGSSIDTWIVVLLIIFIPGLIFEKTKLPAPQLMAPLITAIIIGEWKPTWIDTPDLIQAAAFLLIGWQAGGAFDRSSLIANIKRIPVAALGIIFVMCGCTAIAGVLTASHVGTMTENYLATTPGGIYVVLAIAHDQGAGPVVTVMQVVRMIVMLVVTAFVPTIVRIATSRYEKKSGQEGLG